MIPCREPLVWLPCTEYTVAIANRQQGRYSNRPMNTKEVVLITGGAKRLGREIALYLAMSGYRIIVHCNQSTEQAKILVDELVAQGCEAFSIQGDLSKTEHIPQLFSQALQAFGQVDHLINNASLFPSETMDETDFALFEQVMAVHSTAPFFLAKELYQHLKARSAKGSVINMLDTKLSSPTASRPAYYCAKGSLAYQTKALAVALGPILRVNAVSPGLVLSNGDDAYFAKVAQQIALKKTGSALDICQAVSYLLEASFVTGMELCVDGGQRLL